MRTLIQIGIYIALVLILSTSAFAQNKNLKLVRKFAENYRPNTKTNNDIARLIDIPEFVIKAFQSIRTTNKPEHEKYLVLIFVKLYLAHLKCCHQSYEVRNNLMNSGNIDSQADPLVYEFNLMTRKYKPDDLIGFISSNIGYEWVRLNPYLLNYTKIKVEVAKIENELEKIMNGVYLKD